MPVIVDTFNVLHQTGVLPPSLAGVDVAGLIDLISRSRYRRHRVRLVCDGATTIPDHEANNTGSMTIEFSGKGRTADDVIARHVNRSTAPRRLTIVSSDREVQKAARRRRCTVIRSEEFLSQLAMDVERDERRAARREASRPRSLNRALSQRDIARWMRELGVDEHQPPVTEEQLEELERKVNALLGQGRDDDEAEDDAPSPPQSRAEARRQRARERDEKQLEARDRAEGPPLPLDILAEAERLWRRERGRDQRP